MARDWKSWLASASVLLLVGAGCAGSVDQNASLEAETGVEAEDDSKAEGGASLNASVDAAVDAAFAEVDASSKQELEENDDAEIVGNDSAELKAYGNTYVESEL